MHDDSVQCHYTIMEQTAATATAATATMD